jgi:uncharacterized membrane protein YbaN (DUF454 family)
MLENCVKKTLYNIAGTIALLLGIVGIFLPLLPTTPFLLLASACFLRGSERMHHWLMNHRHLGPYLRNYQQGRGIPLRVKITALTMMWTSMAVSIWIVPVVWVKALLAVIAVCVTIHLLRIRTLDPAELKLDQISRE